MQIGWKNLKLLGMKAKNSKICTIKDSFLLFVCFLFSIYFEWACQDF